MNQPLSDRFSKTNPEKLQRVHGEHMRRTEAAGARSRQSNVFRRFAQTTATATGKPWAFGAAALGVVLWAVLGPMFHFSDTWQLVINTTTTIITFLMVFLIQNTQNRDTEALRLKLDELILATREARNEFVQLEELDDEEIQALKRELCQMAEKRSDDR